MEGLKTRAFVAAGLMCVVALIVFGAPKRRGADVTETQLEDKVPSVVRLGDQVYDVTLRYHMDPQTYKTLAPVLGIPCRNYGPNGRRLFDVALIASSSRSSFHDPRVCFAGHDFHFDQETKTTVATKTRGSITATILEGTDDNNQRSVAAYFYKGPGGFSATTVGIKWRLLKHLLVQPFDTSGVGVFYRFIALDPSLTPEQLVQFISAYMDAANESSNGFF